MEMSDVMPSINNVECLPNAHIYIFFLCVFSIYVFSINTRTLSNNNDDDDDGDDDGDLCQSTAAI